MAKDRVYLRKPIYLVATLLDDPTGRAAFRYKVQDKWENVIGYLRAVPDPDHCPGNPSAWKWTHRRCPSRQRDPLLALSPIAALRLLAGHLLEAHDSARLLTTGANVIAGPWPETDVPWPVAKWLRFVVGHLDEAAAELGSALEDGGPNARLAEIRDMLDATIRELSPPGGHIAG